MNKRLKLLISITLIFAIFVSVFVFPASSYETDVETSTEQMILVNVDTNTEVFSKDADNLWYAGYLSELMTFIVAYERIGDLDHTTFKVEKDFASSLPDSDSCLKPYIGQELTAKDLMGIMVISSGNDAAYALADLASGGDRSAFVDLMNEKAKAFGCVKTNFVSPGYNATSDHVTTCRDLYKLYLQLLKIDLYRELMEKKSYIPESLYVEKDEKNNEKYTVYPEASIINEKSPYYFRYVTDAKLSQTEATDTGIVLTTSYHGMVYFFAGLKGLDESEKNVYADARKLVTWAYLGLSDLKLINSDEVVADVKMKTGWGDYMIQAIPPSSVSKTFPNEYDDSLLEYKQELYDSLETPFYAGRSVGRVWISYDGYNVGGFVLVSRTEEGLNMLSDLGKYTSHVFENLMPAQPTEPPAENETAAEATEKPADTKESETQAAEASTATEG